MLKYIAPITVACLLLSMIFLPQSKTNPNPCVTKNFKTETIKNACVKGGQVEAKNVMKAFMKDKKIKSCNECHAKLAPKYELKADGASNFKKYGGK